jgi:outer membrane receptor for ferrienterochelin and colicin
MRMKKWMLWMMAVIAFAALTSTLAAQVKTSGSVSGYITDDAKEPLPGVNVTATSPTAPGTRQAVSDAKGYYRLPPLPPGIYRIVYELDQFGTQVHEKIEINVGAILRIDTVLNVKALNEKEVVVTASAPLIETEKTTMDTVITNDILNSLPILGRDFMSSIRILPGVTDSSYGLSISGGRDTDKNYNIDGADNVDIIQGEIMGGASYQLNMNKSFMTFDQEAIQELSVGRGGFSADVGFGSGGLINVITKSGSNNLHGSLYLYSRSDKWDYKVPYPYTENIFGGSLGGPIVKDKLLFFLTFSPTYNNTGYDPREVYTQNIPSTLKDTTREFSSFFKLTYLINNKHTLNISANVPFGKYDSYVTLWHVAPDFPRMTNKTRGFSLSLTETANLSPNLLVDSILSVGQTTNQTINEPGAHQGFIYIYGDELTAAGTYGADQTFRRTKINWSEKMTLFVDDWAGRHAFNAGFEVRHNGSSQRRALEELIFRYVGWMDEKEITDPFDQKLQQTYIAGYITDSWAPVKSLTLKPGVRLSSNSYRSKLLVEPRFDFAYDPFGDGKTTVRGGANLYYERMNAYVQQFENYPMLRYENVYVDGTIERSADSYRNVIVDPNLKYPRTTELTIGVDREIFKDLSFSASFISRKYRDQLFTHLVNLRDRTTLQRDDPTKSALTLYSNSGRADYQGLHLILQKRFSHNYQFFISYSYQTSKGNSNLFADFSMLQTIFRDRYLYTGDLQMADLSGRTSFDKPYDFKAFASVILPLKILVSGVFNLTAGTPYTEYNRTTRKMASEFQALRSPKLMNFDMRLEKDFRIKGITAKFMIEAFNLTNRVNIKDVFSDVSSADYGKPLSIGPSRRIQLGARFEF